MEKESELLAKDDPYSHISAVHIPDLSLFTLSHFRLPKNTLHLFKQLLVPDGLI